jgi:hypothetical protein
MVKEPQRTLTPEEVARRKATMEGGDPLKRASAPVPVTTGQVSGHSPREGFVRRMERATQAVDPQFVDYDRDGYPDAFVGRSGRQYTQRAQQANYRGRGGAPQPVIYGTTINLGNDGYRQDQIGYRDRLRGRLAALEALAEAEETKGKDKDKDKDEAAERRLRAMAHTAVPSHAKTGVGGGTPRPFSHPDVAGPEAMRPRYTPTQQALMAPQTIPSGQPRNPARKPTPPPDQPPGETVSPQIDAPAPAGNVGAYGVTRQASFGTVPEQGTVQSDGSFIHGGTPTEEPPAGRSVEHTRTVERTRTVEHTAKPVEHKPAEHKPAEHKPVEHKSHEHGKPPEHKK